VRFLAQIKNIFRPLEEESQREDASAQSQEDGEKQNKEINLETEHTITERLKESFSGMKRKLCKIYFSFLYNCL